MMWGSRFGEHLPTRKSLKDYSRLLQLWSHRDPELPVSVSGSCRRRKTLPGKAHLDLLLSLLPPSSGLQRRMDGSCSQCPRHHPPARWREDNTQSAFQGWEVKKRKKGGYLIIYNNIIKGLNQETETHQHDQNCLKWTSCELEAPSRQQSNLEQAELCVSPWCRLEISSRSAPDSRAPSRGFSSVCGTLCESSNIRVSGEIPLKANVMPQRRLAPQHGAQISLRKLSRVDRGERQSGWTV